MRPLANLPRPQFDGVIDVEVNRPAWSVIVHYDVDVNPLDDVMEHIATPRPLNGANGSGAIRTLLINGYANGSNSHPPAAAVKICEYVL